MSSPMSGYRGAAGGNLRGNSAGSNLMGKAPKGYRQLNNFTPDQMQLFQEMFGQVSPDSFTSRLAGGDESAFGEIEAPAMRQFQEMTGENASRFSGMGMGARGGSGFQNAQNQATSDFAMNLSANRQALRRQAIQDLMGMSGQLLGQRPFDLVEKQQKQKSGWGGLIGAGVGGLGGFLAGGPAGAMGGATLGYNVGSKF